MSVHADGRPPSTRPTVVARAGDDGRRWPVALRPLLPHEGGCGDLVSS